MNASTLTLQTMAGEPVVSASKSMSKATHEATSTAPAQTAVQAPRTPRLTTDEQLAASRRAQVRRVLEKQKKR